MDDTSSGQRKSANVAGGAVGAAIAGVILLLFGTPLRVFWVDAANGWWIVYLLWVVAIGLIGFFTWRSR
jgi:hypothetical protein